MENGNLCVSELKHNEMAETEFSCIEVFQKMRVKWANVVKSGGSYTLVHGEGISLACFYQKLHLYSVLLLPQSSVLRKSKVPPEEATRQLVGRDSC